MTGLLDMDRDLAESQQLAERSNLRITPSRTRAGDVTHWRVYRTMPSRRVYLGCRVSPTALLRFVRALAG